MPSLLGRHMPLESSPLSAFRTARQMGCDAIQLFVGNPRGWSPPVDIPSDTTLFIQGLREQSFQQVVIHAAYLINLASATEATRQKSATLLRWTLERGHVIGASSVVMHTGSHGGDGLATGTQRLIEGLIPVLTDLRGDVRLLLENDVGAGNTIGSQFSALAEVLAALDEDFGDRLGVCIDTAHLWGAGYDIGTPAAATAVLDTIDATIGLSRVKVIHLNDTAVSLGSHRDLHARLGEGIIGQEGLATLLQDERLQEATVLLETPIMKDTAGKLDWVDDQQRIAYARELAGLMK